MGTDEIRRDFLFYSEPSAQLVAEATIAKLLKDHTSLSFVFSFSRVTFAVMALKKKRFSALGNFG